MSASYNVQENIDTRSVKPPPGLFDKIIAAISLEKEFKKTSKLLFFFIALLLISTILMPFSVSFFTSQWKSSGVYYFIATALGNMRMFFVLWQDFTLSILEALPVMGILLLAANMALLLFTVRLFLHKQGLLLRYIKHKFI